VGAIDFVIEVLQASRARARPSQPIGLSGRQLLQKPVAVCLGLRSVTAGLLAVKTSLLAVGRLLDSTLGRHGASSRRSPVVLRTHHDLRAVTCRTVVARQLAVAHLGDLVASQRDQVASVRNLITIVCCLGASMGAVEALLGAAVAN
jgi:hypothetical protein